MGQQGECEAESSRQENLRRMASYCVLCTIFLLKDRIQNTAAGAHLNKTAHIYVEQQGAAVLGQV